MLFDIIRVQALIADHHHRTFCVAHHPGGVGAQKIVHQFRPVRPDDYQVGGNDFSEFENFIIDFAVSDGLPNLDALGDVFRTEGLQLLLYVGQCLALEIVGEKAADHRHSKIRHDTDHVQSRSGGLDLFNGHR